MIDGPFLLALVVAALSSSAAMAFVLTDSRRLSISLPFVGLALIALCFVDENDLSAWVPSIDLMPVQKEGAP